MNKILIGVLFCLPLKSLRINSSYGYRIHPITREWKKHWGIDLFARHDTIYSILDGVIEKIDFDEQTGLYIKVRHSEHLETLYGHLSAFYVLRGDSVSCGQPIGMSGSTGRVTGEHLHFAVKYNNQFINPLAFLYGLLKTQDHE